MEAEVVFCGPPPNAGKPRLMTRFAAVLDELRARPGEWARIAHYPSRAGAWYVPTALKRQGVTDFDFEVRSSAKAGESFLWACYRGEAHAA